MIQWRHIYLIVVLCVLTGCSGYKIEGGEVFWQMLDEGRGKTMTLVSGAEADTFVILRHERYGKDSTGCYYEGQHIPEADPDSFESIFDYYAKDAQRAFYGGAPISGADGNSFQVLEGNWSCDENNCFFMRSMVPGSDPESFKIYGGYLDSWAGDNNSYYFASKRVPVADFSTFSVLQGGFAKDSVNVYFKDEIVAGADTTSFQMVKDTHIGMDKNGYFRFGEPFEPPEVWLNDMGLTKPSSGGQ